MKKGLRILGIVLIFMGIAVMLNSALIFTGLVVAESSPAPLEDISRLGTLIGTGMLVLGAIFLKLSSRSRRKE